MKKNLLIALSLAALLTGCSKDEEQGMGNTQAVSFEAFVGKTTPTRVSAKTDFAEGDDFGVIAYRHAKASWADGVTKTQFMDNVQVTLQGSTWTYAPIQFWEAGVNHTFLAYSPYNAGYTLSDGLLTGVSTATEAFAQTDILYSVPDAGSKDQVWTAQRQVTLNFHHALSQIRLSASTDQDCSDSYTVTVRGVKLTGIHNTGSLNLNAADAEVSPWSAQATTPDAGYTVSTGELNVALSTTGALLNAGNELFMQLPQELSVGTATFQLVCDITATAAGSASNNAEGKVLSVSIPAIAWEHGRIYHYKVQMNRQQVLGNEAIWAGKPDVVEWETGSEVELPADLAATMEASSKQFPMEGSSNELTITNPAAGSAWTLSLSEGADTWLSLKDESGNAVTGGTAGQTVYAVATANHTGSARTATITLTRDAQEPVQVEVTQAASEALTVSATSVSFTYEAGTQKLTITNPEAGKDDFAWTLEGNTPDWLTVSPTTGEDKTGEVSFTALINTTVSDARTAEFTLKRTGQADIPITITQAGAPATTLSATTINADYAAQDKEFSVTSPAGIAWALATQESWITISSESGNGDATIKLTLEANTSTIASRSGTVTLTREGQSPVTLTVEQEATPATTLTPAEGYKVYASEANNTYTFTVNAIPGKQWMITTVSEAKIYKLNDYMTFTYNGYEYEGVGKNFIGYGTGTFTITVKGYSGAVSSGQLVAGIFNLHPDGEDAIGSGVKLLPDPTE